MGVSLSHEAAFSSTNDTAWSRTIASSAWSGYAGVGVCVCVPTEGRLAALVFVPPQRFPSGRGRPRVRAATHARTLRDNMPEKRHVLPRHHCYQHLLCCDHCQVCPTKPSSSAFLGRGQSGPAPLRKTRHNSRFKTRTSCV